VAIPQKIHVSAGRRIGPGKGFSAKLAAAYYVWVLYDLAWTYQLWRLNGSA